LRTIQNNFNTWYKYFKGEITEEEYEDEVNIKEQERIVSKIEEAEVI
jgi:hypothetical protein